ncbi:MAG: sodium:calcium antiporter [Chloroflexi bacterium]|nr:sodium:calcium antiporter [Chloroflexota bacterium]
MKYSKAANWLPVILAALAGVPWIIFRLGGIELEPVPTAILSGLGIVGAAFLLSWGAEVAELDIPRNLALTILALVAVLPEYAVDMVLTWKAGQDPQYLGFPCANMTGSNRLLIGVGWAFVVFFWWLKTKKSEIKLDHEMSLEIIFLGLATLYSFVIPLKGNFSLIDTVVLVGLFVLYVRASLKGKVEEPILVGPAAAVGELPTVFRRTATILFFVFSGFLILISAEPFADGLIKTGAQFGIEQFLLIQWIAPLASEAPEFIVAILFTLRLKPLSGMGTLLSSKINQWTLLVGMIPLVFCISTRSFAPLPLDPRQVEEMLLTTAQSFLALILIADLRFSFREAAIIFVLFMIQLLIPVPEVRWGFIIIYFLLGIGFLIFNPHCRNGIAKMFRQLLGKEA